MYTCDIFRMVSEIKLFHCTVVWIWRQFLPLILLIDEVTFTRNGINNICNSHRWCRDKPHGSVETNFQRRFTVNVWRGMTDDVLIGPVTLDDRMTDIITYTSCKMDYQEN
jgi:hypothetical protein